MAADNLNSDRYGNMISTIYRAIDDESEKSLSRLNMVAESKIFLAGLGVRCQKYKIGSAYPVVKDYSRAYYLMVSQDMWDQPQPTDEKYFVGIVEDSVDQFKHYERDEQMRRFDAYSRHMDDFGDYMRNRIALVFKTNMIYEYLPDGNDALAPATYLNYEIYSVFVNEIYAYFLRMILGSYFGGLEKWPVANHLLSCFETGGLPCGWIGPEIDDGGAPQECMQVLHFG